MPKLTQEVKQVQEPELLPELTVEQQQRLLHEIAIYEALAEEAKENAELLEAQKTELNRLRADFGKGAKTVSPAEGFLLTFVGGESSKLDKTGLMKRFGITPKQWAEFVKKTPKKPHLRITTPNTTKEAAKHSEAADERDDFGEER